MRYYVRYPDPAFKTTAEMKNWRACNSVFKQLAPDERELLETVYQGNGTIDSNVREAAMTRGIKQAKIWALIGDVERRIAKHRGLL